MKANTCGRECAFEKERERESERERWAWLMPKNGDTKTSEC